MRHRNRQQIMYDKMNSNAISPQRRQIVSVRDDDVILQVEPQEDVAG